MNSCKNGSRCIYTVTVPTPRRARSHHHVIKRNESYIQRLVEAYQWTYGGEYQGEHTAAEPPFFFPHDILLMSLKTAADMGIRSSDDFYGGLVPEPFLATKVIMHPLVSAHAQRPRGWSDQFAESRREAVPVGFAAFSKEDAREAGRLLLAEAGAVRAKDPTRASGRGQTVIRSLAELEALLARLDDEKLACNGYIFERNLLQARTLCVGMSRINGDIISYYGKQRQIEDKETQEVEYGGTDLVAVRGEYEELARLLPFDEYLQQAIKQVAAFHRALSLYEEIVVSRMNVDVVQGYDEKSGQWFSILTDPSFRAGGAPDLVALAELRKHQHVRKVVVSGYNTYYQENEEPPVIPTGATIHFHGKDEAFLPEKYMLIYSKVERLLL
ncbi:uncharacterized protein DUF3182 [Thermosporothrix hazakensis]|uniref:Uncharacterized protein DUF3182 n=2 Tax=Thermosporothrix TaxID=768650 RepID=A0A326U4K5_THEHA|nr:DUF3182 family protein [Thermosporothrix hazakensis]PZW27943.1 uncharacterized protein DUF3182 [Thermosporothrix hazakensis]BBH86871.1 hypothetical protein KTC_16220 [Thermosporothrix sp. COM3]GCE51167.1 hypothetical protein KTH_60360 [Thermosporothrix hazakensis]